MSSPALPLAAPALGRAWRRRWLARPHLHPSWRQLTGPRPRRAAPRLLACPRRRVPGCAHGGSSPACPAQARPRRRGARSRTCSRPDARSSPPARGRACSRPGARRTLVPACSERADGEREPAACSELMERGNGRKKQACGCEEIERNLSVRKGAGVK